MGPKKGGAPKVRVDFSNPANLIQVLQMLNANDTATIKTAEKALKPFTKDPANAAMLVSILGSCGDGAVRHHAALLLRKKLGSFYPKYPAAQQTLLKGELIRLVLAEPDSDVATAIAGAIAATASAAFELQQQWPELFALLVQLLAEPEDRLRILTFKILSEVNYLERFGDFNLIIVEFVPFLVGGNDPRAPSITYWHDCQLDCSGLPRSFDQGRC